MVLKKCDAARRRIIYVRGRNGPALQCKKYKIAICEQRMTTLSEKKVSRNYIIRVK